MHEVVRIGFFTFLLHCSLSLITFPIDSLLNPSLNCFVRFTLSLVDKVTIETCDLMSVISNFAEFPALENIQCSIQF